MTKKWKQWKSWEKKSFQGEINSFFINLKGHPFAKNYLRPDRQYVFKDDIGILQQYNSGQNMWDKF